ncbi:SMI1/KNR4 family protein [Aeoliella straminimaris]|uniref:SMI1/KNR4 family protein n=1 Tax=Aeoliella straminimaris TaxID=2954799 RepID=UPI003CC59B30
MLREHAHTVYNALRPPATDSAITNLSAEIPCQLPSSLLQSLQVHDGIEDSRSGAHRLFDNMALLTAEEIASTWRMQWNLQCECDFGGCHFTQTRSLKNDARWRRNWIPIMDCEGDHLVLDLDPGPTGKHGQVFAWYNYGSRPMRVVAESLRHWLHVVADELQHRRFTLDEWGHISLNKRLT